MESSRLMRDSIFSTATSAPVTAEKLLTASHLYGAINHREISGKTVCKVWVCCILGSFCCILTFGCVFWNYQKTSDISTLSRSCLPQVLSYPPSRETVRSFPLPSTIVPDWSLRFDPMAELQLKSSLVRKGTDRSKSPKKAWWKLPKSAIKDPILNQKRVACRHFGFRIFIWKFENLKIPGRIFFSWHSFSFSSGVGWIHVTSQRHCIFSAKLGSNLPKSPNHSIPSRHRLCEWNQRTLSTKPKKIG